MFVPTFAFTLTEHDPERPWLVVAQERHTVDLEPGVSFSRWARAEWPNDRFTVQLDPWQASP